MLALNAIENITLAAGSPIADGGFPAFLRRQGYAVTIAGDDHYIDGKHGTDDWAANAALAALWSRFLACNDKSR